MSKKEDRRRLLDRIETLNQISERVLFPGMLGAGFGAMGGLAAGGNLATGLAGVAAGALTVPAAQELIRFGGKRALDWDIPPLFRTLRPSDFIKRTKKASQVTLTEDLLERIGVPGLLGAGAGLAVGLDRRGSGLVGIGGPMLAGALAGPLLLNLARGGVHGLTGEDPGPLMRVRFKHKPKTKEAGWWDNRVKINLPHGNPFPGAKEQARNAKPSTLGWLQWKLRNTFTPNKMIQYNLNDPKNPDGPGHVLYPRHALKNVLDPNTRCSTPELQAYFDEIRRAYQEQYGDKSVDEI